MPPRRRHRIGPRSRPLRAARRRRRPPPLAPPLYGGDPRPGAKARAPGARLGVEPGTARRALTPAGRPPQASLIVTELGDILREARQRQGASQRALARRSGIAQPAISRIERGAESPSFERFSYLLSCLGLKPSVKLEPLAGEGDRDQLGRSPSERLAGAVKDAEIARDLRHRGMA